MDDSSIVALYWERSESAIYETQQKYGHYCYSIASNILPYREDAQECVNDTYLAAWNSIPPHRPNILSTYLGKLTRRISIDRWRTLTAEKRGSGTVPLALDELSECIPGRADPAATVEAKEVAEAVNRFLDSLSPVDKRLFLTRYFQLASLKDMEAGFGMGAGRLKSRLHRIRGKLRIYLKEEGF